MSKGKNQHVVPGDGLWPNVGEGNARATVLTDTERAAIDRAARIATHQHSELLIHGRNGQIRERNNHGHDPRDREG